MKQDSLRLTLAPNHQLQPSGLQPPLNIALGIRIIKELLRIIAFVGAIPCDCPVAWGDK